MLKELALNYYYSSLSVYKHATSDEMCDSTQRYFDNIRYKRGKNARVDSTEFKPYDTREKINRQLFKTFRQSYINYS